MNFIVKNTTFPNPLALLAPHSCRGCGRIGEPLCNCCKNYIILNHENYCPNCKNLNPTGKCPNCQNLPPIFVADQRSTLIGTLIHDYKYHSVRALSKSLAEILNHILPLIDGPVKIVPLPTINQHIHIRGFDHTYLIAKSLVKMRPNWQLENLLLRSNNSVQVGSDAKTRLTQAKNAYALNPKISLNQSATYLLLDDVWTTGASMQSAYQKLTQAGLSKIIITVLAVS
ncbi:ComF family protein [Candidatus Saccharibacteria bacterium]|nr:ComF family protein [Candidatus Saccharibacteria bacterium]